MLTHPNPKPSTVADAAVVTLRCSIPGCSRWQSAQGRHLANLLAAGPWRCPSHKSTEPDEGMSTRAIAPIVGASQATVVRDVAAADSNDSVDGGAPCERPPTVVRVTTGLALDEVPC